MNALERALRHERAFVALGLVALTLLAWLHLWQGAGMGMSALAMTRVALFPHLLEDMAAMASPPLAWFTVVAMWWVMMIAMMTPSAAPLVLLYGRVVRHHQAGSGRAATTYAASAFLAGGYLLVWLAFSMAATLLQYWLQHAGLLSPGMLWSRSAALSAIVLAAAGTYQLSPLKHACLRRCRGPAQLLTRHWHDGRAGALRMGIEHGAWCVGCCWLLMALLFVGGVMNLVWIVLLASLVLVEKLVPAGVIAGRIAGVVLIAWSLATLAA